MKAAFAIFSAFFILIATNAKADDRINDIVAKVEHYLNGLTTVTSKFTQVAPDGNIAEGVFYLQRPGKMRWEYDPPVPIVMVGKDGTLTYYDKELQQTNHIPIKDTLAGFLTRERISLTDNIVIDSIEQDAGMVRVALHQKSAPDEGGLTLEFAEAPFRLNSMSITDATNQETRIAFSGAVFGQPIDQKKFDINRATGPRRER